MKALLITLLLAIALKGAGHAQTTSSVSGPEIDSGEREVEYRLGAGFGDTIDDAALAHRLHIQSAVSESLRWRLRAFWRDPDNGSAALDHVQAELHWQWIEVAQNGYASGFRFNVRASQRAGDADEIGVTWLNQWQPAAAWRLRALASVDHELGADAAHDWMLETRIGVRREVTEQLHLSLESFNDFSNGSHQIGPVISGELFNSVDWATGVLFGLSEGADDVDLMVRLGRVF
jgi:hypothetical protein